MLVRTDLTESQQLCQAVHAAHEAGIRFGDPQRISSVVVCSVPDEASLLLAKEKLDRFGIRSSVFVEPDLSDQSTALATEPIVGVQRKALSRYPLWGPAMKEV